ncbi:MAG: hypothetical protein GQ564_00420 [Bacteroidales bacterium]|nr:hypothetical protein [Bacteroidales bacterium]
MKTFQFKKLEIKQEASWLKRLFSSDHLKKTAIYSIIGALVGYILFYLGQAEIVRELWNDEALKNMLIGIGFAIFLTNSPCAKGRC